MRTRNLLLALAITLACFMAFVTVPAQAETEAIVESVTLDASDSSVSVTFDFEGLVKEVFLYVPTLDAGDISSMTLVMQPFDDDISTDTVVPNGWTDKAIGATEDGAVVTALSSVGTMYLTGQTTVNLYTATDQAADREFWILFIREY